MVNRMVWFGVRGATRVVAALGVCAAVLVVSAPAQAASGTSATCNGSLYGPLEITGNLTVPAYAFCDLEGVTVDGNVSVGQGADLLAAGDLVKRNLSTEGADAVFMIFNEVDGNSSFDATSGSLSICGYGVSNCQLGNANPGIPNAKPHGLTNKFGNVSITNTSPAGAIYAGNYVAHDLSCYGNAFVTNEGSLNTVLGHEFGQCAGL
jgi:hypothetical protein